MGQPNHPFCFLPPIIDGEGVQVTGNSKKLATVSTCTALVIVLVAVVAFSLRSKPYKFVSDLNGFLHFGPPTTNGDGIRSVIYAFDQEYEEVQPHIERELIARGWRVTTRSAQYGGFIFGRSPNESAVIHESMRVEGQKDIGSFVAIKEEVPWLERKWLKLRKMLP